jgi:hypothetical protein
MDNPNVATTVVELQKKADAAISAWSLARDPIATLSSPVGYPHDFKHALVTQAGKWQLRSLTHE